MVSPAVTGKFDGGGRGDDGVGRQKCGRDEDWRCREEWSLSPKHRRQHASIPSGDPLRKLSQFTLVHSFGFT